VKSRVGARPLRGISKLLKAVRDLDRLEPSGRKVLLIVDGDHIREHLDLPHDADEDAIQHTLARSSSDASRIVVCVLHRNVETLIEAASACDKSLSPQEVEAALRKDVNARDAILLRVARGQHFRAIRDCIRREMPSFSRAADTLATMLAA
jgi:hypothetical protein